MAGRAVVNRFSAEERVRLDGWFTREAEFPQREQCEAWAKAISESRAQAAAEVGDLAGQLRAHAPVNAQQVKNWFDNRRRMKRWDTYKPIGTLSAVKRKATKAKIKKENNERRAAVKASTPVAGAGARFPGGVPGGALPPWVQTMDLLPLIKKMQYRTYAKEEFILREGEFSSEMYFLLKGKVKVSKGDTFLAMLNEGSFFGEMGAVAKGPRTASVQAQTPVHAFVLMGSDVQQMMAVSPEAGQKLVGEATARLEELLIQSQAKKEEESKAVDQGKGKKGKGKKDKSEKDDKASPGTISGAGGGLVPGPQVEYMVAKPGEVVISEGELTDDFYFLRSGEVEVSKEGRVVATLRGGSFFGEMAALCPGPRTSRVMALTYSEMFKMRGEVLRAVFHAEPTLQSTIGETLSTIASARVQDTLAALVSGDREPGILPQHLALAGSEMEHNHRIDILQLLKVVQGV